MPLRRSALAAGLLALAGAACTDAPAPPRAAPPTTNPSASPSPTTGASPSPSSGPPSVAPTAASYGGTAVSWPRTTRRAPAPPALGAVRTLERVRTSAGRTLAAGLLLPRVGTDAVLTPCGARVSLRGRTERVAPSTADDLVLLDPGHGGSADGTRARDGTREAARVLDIARRTAPLLTGRVLLTRSGDHDASLPFRVALADALRADLAVSVHLNAWPEGELDRPGTSVFGSTADPRGRRAAGVLYESLRRALEPLAPRVGGRWAGNADAGALYRLGSSGGDYYGLLRRASTTWVIAEPLFLSDPQEAALVADPAVRQRLAQAYADGVRAFLAGAPGSGWRTPRPRPADPPPPPGQSSCTDPA